MRVPSRLVTNTWRKASFDPEQLLTKPQTCAILDYRTLENQDVDAQLTWAISRSGTGHGLSIWFDSMLTEGVSFSNAPGAPELIYGNAFFPWSTAVDLSEGDMVSVTLQAKLIGTDYVWTWDTRIESVNEPRVVKAQFKQSTFYGSPMSPTTLRKRAASHVPTVAEDGEIDRHILMLMDGNTPLNDIAARRRSRIRGMGGSARPRSSRLTPNR